MSYDAPTLRRFWIKVHKTDTCWLWTGLKDAAGYGRFFCRVDDPQNARPAHRFAFHAFVRELSEGECVLHKCDVPACVNPDHLFAGSYTDNNRDMFAKKRAWQTRTTHCPSGHPYDSSNANVRDGRRYCRQCGRVAGRRREQLRRAGEFTPHLKDRRVAVRKTDGAVFDVFTPRSKSHAATQRRIAAAGAPKWMRRTITLDELREAFDVI